MISAPVHIYSNRMGRIVLMAMEEILGHAEVSDVLSLAHHPDIIGHFLSPNQDPKILVEHAGQIQTAMERAYGPRAGQGLSVRVGRACLKYSLCEFGRGLGFTDLAFRLLPLPTRLKEGSEKLAGLFNQFTDQRVRLEMGQRFITWHIERCPLCRERHADSPCCSLAVGFLQEALYWVSGGKTYLVEEKNCIACGDRECTIVIDKIPIS